MGFATLLRFTLLCFDLLAWPAIALGYPLFASIRAVESGSKDQMKKLVIYWTLFSLFSLFEFAFVKIIEWIPVWSSVRLVVIFWLVVPHFDGSNHAYEILVRPILLMKLEAVIDRFRQLEERFCKKETVLDVVQKYIKENGPEAMEKLIALEYENHKGLKFQKETKVLDSEGKSTTATSEQASWEDTESFEDTEEIATATKTHQALYEQSMSSVNRTDVVSNVKETVPSEASADNTRPWTPPRLETQQEWTCDLCKVTTMSEMVLNAHLQGKKHKSKLESLKASLLGAKDTRSSTLVQHKQTVSAAKVKELMPQKGTSEMRCGVRPPLEKAQKEWICEICKVTTTSKMVLNAHYQGRKHMSKLETLVASKLTTKVTGPSHSATSEVNHGNVSEKFIIKSGTQLEKSITSKLQVQIDAKETTPSEASVETRHAGPPAIKQAQQEWTCDLCKVRTTSEKTLNDHFNGNKHKDKLVSLKTSELHAKDTDVSPSSTREVNKDGE